MRNATSEDACPRPRRLGDRERASSSRPPEERARRPPVGTHQEYGLLEELGREAPVEAPREGHA
eukprot:8073557-Alexandrium_andersonii.AAC.1